MNTRGLTELVVVTVGFRAGLISQDLLTVFVVMAVVTTMLTKPLLKLVYPDPLIARDVVDAERRAAGTDEPYRCLVLADDMSTARDHALLARDLTVRPGAVELVICWFAPLPGDRTPGSTGLAFPLDGIGGNLQQANSVADEVSGGNVSCSVVHRLSDDPRRDTLQQVETWQPDCVVAHAALDYADEVIQSLIGDGQLLLVGGSSTPASDGPVTVNLAGGPDTVAALALAIRLARARGIPLQVAGRSKGARWSRPSSLVARLSRAGIKTQPAPLGRHPDGLVVTDGGHAFVDGASTRIRVRAARPGTADDLTRRVSEAASATTPTLSRSQA